MLTLIRKRRNLNLCRHRSSTSRWGAPNTKVQLCKRINPNSLMPADRACGRADRPTQARRSGRCRTLIRHATTGLKGPVGLLPCPVRQFARFGALIPCIGGTRLPAAGSLTASIAAITLASVAPNANKEHRATTRCAARSQAEGACLGGWLFRFCEVHGNTITQKFR